VNETIPQLDGADDVPNMPQRRRFGMRGRSFSQQPLHKSSTKNAVCAVVGSDASAQTETKEKMFCKGVTELKTNEFCLLTDLERESMHVSQEDDFVDINNDSKNPVITGDVETEHENNIRECLLNISNDSNGSVMKESIDTASETVLVATCHSVTDIKSSTREMETSTEIRPVEVNSLFVFAGNDNSPVGIGSMKSVSEDCPSSINGVVEHATDDNGMETEPRIDLDTVVAASDSVDPVLSGVKVSESLKIFSEDLPDISEDNTVPSIVIAESKPSIFSGLSEVLENSNVQVTRVVGSQSANLAVKQTCNGFGLFLPTDGSSNSEMNFQPVSVVCCNTYTSSCMSDGSVHDLQLNSLGSNVEVGRQDCEQFGQGVLIGDPSFMAQSSLSGDNDFQVNEPLCNGNTFSTSLCSDQNLETSKSSYLSDIDTYLLAQYDTQTIQEISSEKNTVSCRTSYHHNSDQKQNSGSCTRLIQSRKVKTRNSKLHYTCDSVKSNSKMKKSCMQYSEGNDLSVERVVTKWTSRCVLPKGSLNAGTERKEVPLPAVSMLKSPVDVSPVEVKRIETILWEGNIDEIIQPKDGSINDGLSSQNEVENAREMLESYVQKIEGKTKNGHRANANNHVTGKKSKEELALPIGDRMDRSAVSTQTQNVLSKLIYQNSNTMTKKSMLPASQQYAVAVNDKKYAGHSNGIYLKKLARKQQRERRRKLSLSYRRKTTSLTSEDRNICETNSVM
jgi:hypothetical protein